MQHIGVSQMFTKLLRQCETQQLACFTIDRETFQMSVFIMRQMIEQICVQY